MNSRWRSGVAGICGAAVILLMSGVAIWAQGSQAPSNAPAEQPGPSVVLPDQPAVGPSPKSDPVQQAKPTSRTPSGTRSSAPISCASEEKRATAGGASISTQVGDSGDQPKQWQPRGGDVSFTIVSFTRLDANAQVLVCFRWAELSEQTKPGDQNKPGAQTKPVFQNDPIERRPKSIALSSDGRTLKVGTAIPRELQSPPWDRGVYSMYLIPITEVRILVLSPDSMDVQADVTTTMGVSELWMAWLLVILAVAGGYFLLNRFSRWRLDEQRFPANLNPILRIISTPGGFASLSQLQIMLWTFVVGASVVYVMALSGELIEITNGTLILLGISGAATIGTQIVGRSENPPATGSTPSLSPSPPPTSPPPSAAATSPQAPATTPPAVHDRPMWSDLIMNERGDSREIDVTRVQMLYFTFITAAFVLMKVFTTYVIPVIPDGFLALMGLSNLVYMGAKVARKKDD